MRASILIVVLVGLFAANQALDLKEIGKNLVNTLVEKGKSLLSELTSKLLGSLAGALGKRDLATLREHALAIAKKLHGFIHAGKEKMAGVFGKAIDALRAISDKFHARLGLLKDAKEASDAVDDVVADHHVEQKRLLGDLLQKGKDLLSSAVEKLKNLGSALKAKASEVVSGLIQKGADLLVGKRALKPILVVQQGHLGDNLNALNQDLGELFRGDAELVDQKHAADLLVGKRALSDHLKTIGDAISGVVSPFKDIVAGLGNTLKGHFSNLVDTVKGHVSALKDKLSGHVANLKTHGQTLLEHGKNALGALGEVVTDILKQTLTNAGPAIDGLAKTASDAGSTILNHFTGADKTATF